MKREEEYDKLLKPDDYAEELQSDNSPAIKHGLLLHNVSGHGKKLRLRFNTRSRGKPRGRIIGPIFGELKPLAKF